MDRTATHRRRWSLLLGTSLAVLALAVVHSRADGTDGHGNIDGVGRYALLDGGTTWPCAPIHYAISSAELPADFLTVINGAIGRVSAASGFQFFYDGLTPERDFESHLRPGTIGPLLIGFADASDFTEFRGDTIGLGRSVPAVDGRSYSTGQIALDATKYRVTDDPAERQAIVMHELGHVLGLGHVHDAGELMNEDNLGRTEFGPGDLAGLRALHANACPGATSGATPDATPGA